MLTSLQQLTRLPYGKNASDGKPWFPLSPDPTEHASCALHASITICHHKRLSNVLLACSGTESRFLQASMAAASNKPIISDEEYDELKAKLRNKNSKIVQQVGGCSPQPEMHPMLLYFC